MEIFNIENLSFKYNKAEKNALSDINMKIRSGEFLLVIGQSGCGKTTLLKMLKNELTPLGEKSGELFYKGNKLENLSQRESASEIGFITQDPDAQLVTDKVYSELAFGLENLGLKKEIIRSRVAEFSSYFGLGELFERETNTLSGGEKQMLNLACVMVMNPEVILLDEPTSMLDPIFLAKFLNTLKRINDDFGTTVIITEHHLSEVFRLADRVAYLEKGFLKAYNSSKEICRELRGMEIEKTLPAPARIFNAFSIDKPCPITIKEGREYISKLEIKSIYNSDTEIKSSETVLKADKIWFRYEKKGKDILKNCSLAVKKGEIYALLGENGSGKSTLLNVINGSKKAYRGKIKTDSRIGYLPQNPKNVFVKDTLEEDLKLINNSYKEIISEFSLSKYLNTHPYDLSGGELQRASICKVLLTEPDILLLDEPTKGLDNFAKIKLGHFLRNLCEKGLTIILVSHDLEFCAEFSDRCGLLFDGEITSESNSREFFSNNLFYTTPMSKMCKGIIDGAVNVEDIIGNG